MTRKIEFTEALLAVCRAEVTATYPLESGGVLMGRRHGGSYWTVDHVIGPGPNAHHSPTRFSPDLAWQHERIAERFYCTGGMSTYLGDWHSHPGMRHGRMSRIDKRALREIIDSEAAQCPEPLMMILWGGPTTWGSAVWHARLWTNWWGVINIKTAAVEMIDQSRCVTIE